MTAIIRAALPADCDAVAAMVRDLAAMAGVTAGTSGDGLRREAFGERPNLSILVAERHGALVGYAIHQDTYSTWRGANGVFLVDLYVLPAERGSGLGLALMRAVARAGLERGARFMRLDVDHDNDGALRFYARHGFRDHSTLLFRVLEDDDLVRLAGD